MKKKAISNSGPLIHLAKTNLLDLIKQYQIKIPTLVKKEVIDQGKKKGFSDALLIEKELKLGSIKVINIEVDLEFEKSAKIAGLHIAEIAVIDYAYKNEIIAILDDNAARVFAKGMGVKIKGSLGLLVEGLENSIITYSEAINGLNNLAEIMYLNSDIYRFILKKLKNDDKKK